MRAQARAGEGSGCPAACGTPQQPARPSPPCRGVNPCPRRGARLACLAGVLQAPARGPGGLAGWAPPRPHPALRLRGAVGRGRAGGEGRKAGIVGMTWAKVVFFLEGYGIAGSNAALGTRAFHSPKRPQMLPKAQARPRGQLGPPAAAALSQRSFAYDRI